MGTILESAIRSGRRKGRPNYSAEFKQQIVAAACEPGASVSKLAMEHRLNANMVFRWRRELTGGPTAMPEQSPHLLPIVLNRHSSAAPCPTHEYMVEVLIGEARVRISGNPDPAILKMIFQSLRT